MPGRTIEEILQIRQWVADAIEAGANTPNDIIEWVNRKHNDAPALATVIKIMRQHGFSYVDGEWIKTKGK